MCVSKISHFEHWKIYWKNVRAFCKHDRPKLKMVGQTSYHPILIILHSALMKKHENKSVDCVMDYNQKARNHCQDVDNCGDEDHCQDREHCQNGNEHADR